jgi:chemotaxis protein CheD
MIQDTDFFGAVIGDENIAVARELLTRFNIPIVAEDVGGSRGRRVTFDTASGSIHCALLDGSSTRPPAMAPDPARVRRGGR